MKILLSTSENGLNAGGLAFHCNQLKTIYEELGHEVFVEVLLNPNDIKVIDGGYDPYLGNKIRTSYMLKSISSRYKGAVDLCVSCGGGKTAYQSMLICRELKIPLYIVLCGSEINLSSGNMELSFYNSEALKYASAVIGLSNELNSKAKTMNSNSKCKYYVIPNYYDMSGDYSNEIKADVDEGIAFVTGAAYLGEKKGISNLLEAFSKLIHDNGRNDVLYMYGKIDSDIKAAYDKLIEACNIKENVVFCGYLDRPAFEEQMSRADVYIQTSPFEGFGNSVAEALCIGKDILISNTGYIAEVISDDFPDHIIKSLNPDEMAGSIYEYIVRTYSKNDKSEIRKKLSRYVKKNIVIDQWKIVLGDRKSPCINIGMDSCLAVMFHDIDHDYSGVDYGAEGFEKLVKKIHDTGLELCSVRRFFDNPCSDRMIICTFDDGYEGVYKYALPVLKKFGYTATVYICPDLIGQDNAWNHKDVKKRNHLNDEMLVSLVQNGWEIGSHGIAHINLLQLSEHELEKTLSDSKDQLSKYGEIDSFCYPYGSYNLFIKEKVARYYKNAFSVSIGGNNYINDMFQITRVTPEDLIGRLGF